MNVAAWNPCKATRIADKAKNKVSHPVINGLGDLSGAISGYLWRVKSTMTTIPKAMRYIENSLNK